MTEQPFTHIADLQALVSEIPDDSIVSRTYYEDSLVKAILFAFAAGQELSEHTAAQPAILHFLQGEADLILGTEKKLAQAGTWVQMPARLPHSVHAKTSTLMLLLLFQPNK